MTNMTIVNRIKTIYYCFLLSGCFLSTFAQDILTKKNGEIIEAKIELLSTSEVKYKKFNNPNGPSFIVDKSELAQIKLEDGSIESTTSSARGNKISKEETKTFIVNAINEHGFEEDTFDRKYKASFEGDYLRLKVLRRNGEESNDGLLYDFSNVYKFQRVSKRSDQLAYINIYVSILENAKHNKWDKHKLVMRVDSPTTAESIVSALQHYNSILVDAKKESAGLKF